MYHRNKPVLACKKPEGKKMDYTNSKQSSLKSHSSWVTLQIKSLPPSPPPLFYKSLWPVNIPDHQYQDVLIHVLYSGARCDLFSLYDQHGLLAVHTILLYTHTCTAQVHTISCTNLPFLPSFVQVHQVIHSVIGIYSSISVISSVTLLAFLQINENKSHEPTSLIRQSF